MTFRFTNENSSTYNPLNGVHAILMAKMIHRKRPFHFGVGVWEGDMNFFSTFFCFGKICTIRDK
jgi:hypothetical protein